MEFPLMTSGRGDMPSGREEMVETLSMGVD